MTVQEIEVYSSDHLGLNRIDLMEYLNINPHLVASYQVFPGVMQHGGKEPILVIKTEDLSDENLKVFAAGLGLITGKLKFVTPD